MSDELRRISLSEAYVRGQLSLRYFSAKRGRAYISTELDPRSSVLWPYDLDFSYIVQFSVTHKAHSA